MTTTAPRRPAPAPPDVNRYLHHLAPTPLVPVRLDDRGPVVWCKLEFLHPSGSTKDRVARAVLEKAWRQGRLGPGDLVVEASSGSTSIAFALACAQYGLRFVAVMPEGVSGERVALITAYGGGVRLTPRALGLGGALAEAARLAAEQGAFYPEQFANPDNVDAHRFGTAREVLAQIPGGTVDVVVSGVGTGGTLVGLYQGFAEAGCAVRPVLARPVDVRPDAIEVECSSVAAFGPADGAAFSTRVPGVVDGVSAIFRDHEPPGLVRVDVPADDVLATTRRLHRLGFPVGPSSGLNYRAAELAAARAGGELFGAVVTVFPDRAERYFSTELFGRAGQ